MHVTVHRSIHFLASFLCASSLLLAGCSDSTKGRETSGKPALSFSAGTHLLATISDKDAPTGVSTGHDNSKAAPDVAEVFHVVVSEQGNSVAYKAVRGGKQVAVINGVVGPAFKTLQSIVFSPDGTKYAYTAMDEQGVWHLISNTMPDIFFHHIDEPVFSPDSRHVAFRANVSDEWFVVVDGAQTPPSRNAYGPPVFSADSARIAYLEEVDQKRNRLHITDRNFNSIRVVESVVSPIVRSTDGTGIAVVVARNGKRQIMQIPFSHPDNAVEGAPYSDVFINTIVMDGASVAFGAEKRGTRYLVLDGREERFSGSLAPAPPVIRPDRKSVTMVVDDGKGMSYRQAFLADGPPAQRHEAIDMPVFSRDSSQYAYLAKRGKSWFVVVNGSEGPGFDRVVSPIFSPDGSKLVYRARKDGKRFVVVADRSGKTIRQHPPYEQVFAPVFSPEGSSVGYGVKDGAKLLWMVEKL